jgi:CRISPR-associated protein Cas1
VHATPAALRRCAAAGVGVTWLTRQGRLVARLAAPAEQPAATVRAQCGATAADRLAVAQALVAAKLEGQRALLLRRARRLPPGPRPAAAQAAARRLDDALRAVYEATSTATLRGVEGAAAAAYFEAWPALLGDAPLAFGGRSRRPPRDGVNALLSFAYTLAHQQMHGLAEAHGLHPYVGFLHEDRPGHATLASDLLEPLRPAIDHAVLAAVRRGRFTEEDFETTPRGGVYLTGAARPKLFALLDRAVRRPYAWAPGAPSVLWTAMAALPAALARALRHPEPFVVPPFLHATAAR